MDDPPGETAGGEVKNQMNIKQASVFVVLLATGLIAIAESTEANAVGLYYASMNQSGEVVTNADGTILKLGAKADFKVRGANIYSHNNANDDFRLNLDTGDYAAGDRANQEGRKIVLRVGSHSYLMNGWGGSGNSNNSISFNISSPADAVVIAQAFSVECPMRVPPGYKYLAQFIPTKSEFPSNGPVTVKFVLKNLDTKTIVFQSGGQQRGNRDNQYGFRAMFQYNTPVLDVGSPVNFGGLSHQVQLAPGKEFVCEVDLKKWFAFDKPGNYSIHGFYSLDFYPDDKFDGFSRHHVLWSEYASADFTVVVK